MRWLPYIILIVAGVLFLNDIYSKQQHAKRSQQAHQEKIAEIIRYQASQPIERVLIMHQLEGRSVGIVRACPPELVPNLIDALQRAASTPPFPDSTALEGSDSRILLIHTNGTQSAFRAVRLDNDPETLFVGTFLPEKFSQDEGGEPQRRARLTNPAKIEHGGPILGQILAEIIALGDKLPSDEELRKLNDARRTEEATTEE